MPLASLRRALPAMLGLALSLASLAPSTALAAKPKVPEGFEAKLAAAVPAIEFPCQVATAPDGAFFVAEDPMDQVGPYEAFHGRVLRFKEIGAEPTVFADGFRAVQGMAWHDGSLYVCHMPFLTVCKDADGDGKAESKTILFKDLGPTDNRGLNDHIVSGLQFGMDGKLYISVGDKGVPLAHGIDGRTATIEGGGCLRCNPDGTGLEVYSTGTRNHLEVNLDALDNIFTYDNTDDGLGWWTRVTHHIDGGYYGYPYDYHPRPDRHLPRMAEYGGGSPCGAAFYKEDAWPEKYRGMGFWAEWGKGKVQAFKFERQGASFRVAETIDFAVKDDGLDFRPIDVAFSHDGKTLFVADWGTGGWGNAKEKIGRVWAITYTGKVETKLRRAEGDESLHHLEGSLMHPAFSERMKAQEDLIRLARKDAETLRLARMHLLANGPLPQPLTHPLIKRHLVWVINAVEGDRPSGRDALIGALRATDAEVRAQAARALGERGTKEAVAPLAKALRDDDPSVRLHALIALGRIGDPDAVPAIVPLTADSDPFLAFAARAALRRIGDWKTIGEAGLASADPRVRMAVLAAMESQYDLAAAGELIKHAMGPDHPPAERAKALFYLSQVHRKSKPWDGRWWGTRPADGKPRPKDIEWDGTRGILETVRAELSDPDPAVRIAAFDAVRTTNDRGSLPGLRERFSKDTDENIRRDIALILGEMGDVEALPLLTAALRDPKAAETVRDAALKAVEEIGSDSATSALLELLAKPDLAADRARRVIAALGRFKATAAVAPLVARLGDPSAPVRAASAEALGRIGKLDGVGPALRGKLDDLDLDVRKAAIQALGTLKDREAIPALILASGKADTRFEASLALTALPDIRSLQTYLHGLSDRNPDLRRASSLAVAAIRDQAAPVLSRLAERHELPAPALPELTKIYTGVQPIGQWQILGPFKIDGPPPFAVTAPVDLLRDYPGATDKAARWQLVKAVDDKGQVDLNQVYNGPPGDLQAFGYAEVNSPSARKADVVCGSDDTLTLWVNGKEVYDFADRRGFDPNAKRLQVDLTEGVNRIIARCGNRGGPWQFSVAVTVPAEYAFLKAAPSEAFDAESYRRFAMGRPGNPAKGRALFADLKGLACVKCHAVGGQGGAVGPDLSDIGARYPKDEIIQSILYPSARIFSGYEPNIVATTDGRTLTGIVKSDTAEALELVDAEARTIRIPRADIDARKVSDVSLMPTGLAEGLSRTDFADVIAYLETLKDKPPAAKKP